MKIWKSLVVLIGIALLGWGAFWIYRSFFSSQSVNSLQLIHPDAVFVLETNQADQTWNDLISQPVWSILSQLPAFEKASKQIISLDSLSGTPGEVSKLLRNKQVTISYHAVGINSFELLYTLNFGSSNPSDFLNDIKSKIGKGATVQSRKYSDLEVLEFFGSDNSRKWSATILGNVLLVSPSSFLIEEAIRLFISTEESSLATKLGEQLNQESGPGRLLISSAGIAKLIEGISSDRENANLKELQAMDAILALNLSFEENQLSFKGPAILKSEVDFTPSVKANLSEVQKLISNRTQSLTQINLDGIFESQKLQNSSFSPKSTVSGEIQTRLTDRGFLDAFTGELYLMELENLGSPIQNQVLLARTSDPGQTLAFLKEFRTGSESDQSDFYRDSEILFFPEEEFPAHLFGGKFVGFPQTHLSLVGDLLIMANSASGMKLVLDDFDLGNTLGKAAETSPTKRALIPAAGYSKTFFFDKIWKTWEEKSNTEWSPFLQKYASVFKAFPFLSLRIHQIEGKPVAMLTIPYVGGKPMPKSDEKGLNLTPSQTVQLPNSIIYGPKSILNFNDKTQDIVVQDSDNVLYLINSAGETVYSQKLSGPIVSEVFQIDYLKNGKLQVLLATGEQLYAIDRLGNSLPGFPVKLKGEEISHLSLVDYENSRDYRFFLATKSGNLWLLDRTGKSLDGWKPMKLGEASLIAPRHLRVPGKGDHMIAYTENGTLQLFNRRAEPQPGSPLKLGSSFDQPVAITLGPDGSTPQLTALSLSGELVRANFKGEIVYRNQLEKADRDDVFELLPDPSGNSLLIVSKQYSKTRILNEQEEELFVLPQSGKGLWFGYVDFGSDRKILAVTDPEQGFGYLYDLKGSMLTATPLESTGPIQISFDPSKSTYRIHTIVGNKLLEYLMPD